MFKKRFHLDIAKGKSCCCLIFFMINLFSQELLLGLSQHSIFLEQTRITQSECLLENSLENDDNHSLQRKNTASDFQIIFQSYPFFIAFTLYYWSVFFILFFIMKPYFSLLLISFVTCFLIVSILFLYLKIIKPKRCNNTYNIEATQPPKTVDKKPYQADSLQKNSFVEEGLKSFFKNDLRETESKIKKTEKHSIETQQYLQPLDQKECHKILNIISPKHQTQSTPNLETNKTLQSNENNPKKNFSQDELNVLSWTFSFFQKDKFLYKSMPIFNDWPQSIYDFYEGINTFFLSTTDQSLRLEKEKWEFSEKAQEILIQIIHSWKENKEEFVPLLKRHFPKDAIVLKLYESTLTTTQLEEEIDSFLEKLPLLIHLDTQRTFHKTSIEQFSIDRKRYDPNHNLIHSFEGYQKAFLAQIDREMTENTKDISLSDLTNHFQEFHFIYSDCNDLNQCETTLRPMPLAFLLIKEMIGLIKEFEKKIGSPIDCPQYLIDPLLLQMNIDIQPLDNLKIKLAIDQDIPIKVVHQTIQFSLKWIYKMYREFDSENSRKILKTMYFSHLQNHLQKLSHKKKSLLDSDKNILELFKNSLLTAMCWNQSNMGVFLHYLETNHTFFFCPKIQDISQAFSFFYPHIKIPFKMTSLQNCITDKTFSWFLRDNLDMNNSTQTLLEQLEILTNTSRLFLQSPREKHNHPIVVTTAENVLLFHSILHSMPQDTDTGRLSSSYGKEEMIRQQDNELYVARIWINKFFESKKDSLSSDIGIKRMMQKKPLFDIDKMKDSIENEKDPQYLSQFLFQLFDVFNIQSQDSEKEELADILNSFEKNILFPMFFNILECSTQSHPTLSSIKHNYPKKWERCAHLCYLFANESIAFLLEQYIFSPIKLDLFNSTMKQEISLLCNGLYRTALKVFLEGQHPANNQNIFDSLDEFLLNLSQKDPLSQEGIETKDFFKGHAYSFFKTILNIATSFVIRKNDQSLYDLMNKLKEQQDTEDTVLIAKNEALIERITNILGQTPYCFCANNEHPLFRTFLHNQMYKGSAALIFLFVSQTLSLFIEESSVDFLQTLLDMKKKSFLLKTWEKFYPTLCKKIKLFLQNEEIESCTDIINNTILLLINFNKEKYHDKQFLIEHCFPLILHILTHATDKNSESITKECMEETFFFLLGQCYKDQFIQTLKNKNHDLTMTEFFNTIKAENLWENFKLKLPHEFFQKMFHSYSQRPHSQKLEFFFYQAQSRLLKNEEEFLYNMKRSDLINTMQDSYQQSYVEETIRHEDDALRRHNAEQLCNIINKKNPSSHQRNTSPSVSPSCQTCLDFFQTQLQWDCPFNKTQLSQNTKWMGIFLKQLLDISLRSEHNKSYATIMKEWQTKHSTEAVLSLLSYCLPYTWILNTTVFNFVNIFHSFMGNNLLHIVLKQIDVLLYLSKNKYRTISNKEYYLEQINSEEEYKDLFRSRMNKLSKRVKNLKFNSPNSQKIEQKLTESLKVNGFLVEYLTAQFVDEIIDLIKSLEKKYHVSIPLPSYLIQPLKLKVKMDIKPLPTFDIEIVENQTIPILLYPHKLCIDMERFFALAKKDNTALIKSLKEIYFCAIQNEAQVLFHNTTERRHKDFLLNAFLASIYFSSHEKRVSISWFVFHHLRYKFSPCFAYPKNILSNFLYFDPNLKNNQNFKKLNNLLSRLPQSFFKFINDNIIFNNGEQTPAEQFRSLVNRCLSFADKPSLKKDIIDREKKINTLSIQWNALEKFIKKRNQDQEEFKDLVEKYREFSSLISKEHNISKQSEHQKQWIVFNEKITRTLKKIQNSNPLIDEWNTEISTQSPLLNTEHVMKLDQKLTEQIKEFEEQNILNTPEFVQDKTSHQTLQIQMTQTETHLHNIKKTLTHSHKSFKRLLHFQETFTESLNQQTHELNQLQKFEKMTSNSFNKNLKLLDSYFKLTDIISDY